LVLRDLLQRWFSRGQKVLGTLSRFFTLLLVLVITRGGAQEWLDKIGDDLRGFATERVGDERVGEPA
jgi:hypothetical protein